MTQKKDTGQEFYFIFRFLGGCYIAPFKAIPSILRAKQDMSKRSWSASCLYKVIQVRIYICILLKGDNARLSNMKLFLAELA